ncbi:MAG: SAM-dependent methyltransferase, partial [Clostridia bacterium]|nr:SAM-dependent methyltransferase [Clostridia bacterium]
MDKIRLPVLDERMLLIASQVRDGAVVADIGTDHGYIPIYLVGSG